MKVAVGAVGEQPEMRPLGVVVTEKADFVLEDIVFCLVFLIICDAINLSIIFILTKNYLNIFWLYPKIVKFF